MANKIILHTENGEVVIKDDSNPVNYKHSKLLCIFGVHDYKQTGCMEYCICGKSRAHEADRWMFKWRVLFILLLIGGWSWL